MQSVNGEEIKAILYDSFDTLNRLAQERGSMERKKMLKSIASIVGGIMFAALLGKPMRVKPVLVSKLNTAAQIVFACLVLAALAFGFTAEPTERVIMGIVAVLTLASIGFYVREWVVHMSAAELER